MPFYHLVRFSAALAVLSLIFTGCSPTTSGWKKPYDRCPLGVYFNTSKKNLTADGPDISVLPGKWDQIKIGDEIYDTDTEGSYTLYLPDQYLP